MATIHHLSIATKLRVAFAVMLGLLLAQALFSYARLQSVQGEARELGHNWLPSVIEVSGLDGGLADYRIGLLQTIGATTPDQLQAAERNVAKGLADFKASEARYVKLISGDEERRTYDKLHAAAARFDQAAQRAITAARAQQLDEARRIYDQDTRPAYREASEAANELVALNQRGAAASTARSEALYRSSIGWLIASTVAAVAMALVLAWLLVRAITVPLAAAVRAADRVAAGDLSERIEAGDGGRDEITHLLQAMARMQQALVGTVGSVRGGAESVAVASAQIAQGNADLSSRTEDQASSLEQTSATMEQLNATVRQNADNAAQANQLAQSAARVARDGGQVVGEVVETMHGIEESSRRIADIIATIDGIAFQTNILALNAAVEAARAGEQGRGFAVVAGEVRLLAQRSAEAAKEIKTLIGASVERVQSGTALVDRAGTTIANIVGAVQKLADLVGEISSASREQSSGIAQVGAAVTQLDRTTQQNAALVEQSAAASESLKGQAQALLTAVAGFKLAAGTAPAASTAPRPAPTHKTAAATAIAAARAQPPSAVKAAVPTTSARTPPPPPSPARADGEWASF